MIVINLSRTLRKTVQRTFVRSVAGNGEVLQHSENMRSLEGAKKNIAAMYHLYSNLNTKVQLPDGTMTTLEELVAERDEADAGH